MEDEVKKLINSGLYKIVDLDFFKNLEDIKINEKNKDYMKETLNGYLEYLNMIKSLPEKYEKAFLNTLKLEEIRHNQKAENENSFLIDLYQNIERTNSINMAISIINKKNLTSKDFQTLHDKMMVGTKYQGDNYSFRKHNNITVEGIKAQQRDIHYIPIDKDKIEEAVNLICDYINQDDDNIFIRPFTVHGLISALQAFPDGNTRLARLICYIKIWDLSRKINDINMPAIYLSQSFYLMRKSYRDKIRNLVVYNNNEVWNDWYTFNLHAFNEQLFYGKNNIKQLKKRI